MNPLVLPTRTGAILRFLGSLVLAAFLGGCDQRSTDGGTTDGTSTVAFYTPDGRPAVNARVQVFASSDTTRLPRAQAFTDAQGRVSLPVLDSNLYNLVARDESGRAMFQDSLLSDGKRMDYASDTLVATGVVTGRVRVQLQHDPRIVWVALLGAGSYLNVDDSGRFRIEGVPEGKFTLAGFTKTEGYTTTFKALRVKRDSVSDIGTLDMVFTGLPVVTGLEARFDTLAGLVHLRWDSLPLRETWRYTVLRDGEVLGETVGPKWIDRVSDEYATDVPLEGRHTYAVVVSDASVWGPLWEAIEMRVISAYLYQDVKVEWTRADAPRWIPGLFDLDTADGVVFLWRSAEFGTDVVVPGEATPRKLHHAGWLEQWRSDDTGRTWNKLRDSLPLGAFPIRYRGQWWSVERSEGEIETLGDESGKWWYGPADAGIVYPRIVVVSSRDGERWDSTADLSSARTLTDLRLERDSASLWVAGSCWQCPQQESSYDFLDSAHWRLSTDEWVRIVESSMPEQVERQPQQVRSVGAVDVVRWDRRWWHLHYTATLPSPWTINGRSTPFGLTQVWNPLLWPSILSLSSERALLVSSGEALSFDANVSEFHVVPWPGKGYQKQIVLGDRILSISDSGVYLGRILSGLEGGDPRGTWVKKTEVPRVY